MKKESYISSIIVSVAQDLYPPNMPNAQHCAEHMGTIFILLLIYVLVANRREDIYDREGCREDVWERS